MIENSQRRKATIEETLSPCEGCGYPISNRHHMLEFSKYGENDSDILICPSCHWTLHICVSALFKKSKRSYKIWDHLLRKLGDNDHRLIWAKNKMEETIQKELYEQIGKHME